MLQNDNKLAKIFFIIAIITFIGAITLFFVGQNDGIKRLKFSESLKLKSDKMRILEFYNSMNPNSKAFNEAINSDTAIRNYLTNNFDFIRIESDDDEEIKMFEKHFWKSDSRLLLTLDKHGRPATFFFPITDNNRLKIMFEEILQYKYIFDDELEDALQKSKVNGKLTFLLLAKSLNENVVLFDLLNKDIIKPYIEQNFNLTTLIDMYPSDKLKIQELIKNFNLNDELNRSDLGMFLVLDANRNLISSISFGEDIHDKTGEKFLNFLNSSVEKSLNNAK